MSETKSFDQIRDEAIQMFRDMPNDKRKELLNKILQDEKAYSILQKLDNEFLKHFKTLITRQRSNNKDWYELHDILFYLMNEIHKPLKSEDVKTLYKLIHKLLIAHQAPGDLAQNLKEREHPPPLKMYTNISPVSKYLTDALEIAGVTASGPTSSPISKAKTGAPSGGRRKKTRKGRKQRKLKHKSRKH